MTVFRIRGLALALLLVPLAVRADGVSVKFDLSDPAGSPFPSDLFTVRDWSNTTFRRVNLPKPDCASRPSDCADIDVINTLDGFSIQPRITVPFTGDIDVTSVTSDSVFLVNLGDTLTLRGFGQKVGINQVVWDPSSRTLAFESDELLEEHSRYVLIITDAVRDASGHRIRPGAFGEGIDIGPLKVVAASFFTTQSITADLGKIMRGIKGSTPVPANFIAGISAAGPVRSVFTAASIVGIQFSRQTGAAPEFTHRLLPVSALNIVPGAVGQIAYGTFRSPDYQTSTQYIPSTGTLSGQPLPQGTNVLTFQLFIPAGAKPPGGWPVAIFGHGFTDSMYGSPWMVASVFASQGIATLSINAPGHGGGELGTLSVLRSGNIPVTVIAGGRGIDQDGNGSIDATEGVNAAVAPALIGNRDGLRQAVVDLLQLVRQIEVGMDADGDGTADLNAHRIYYAGQSFGGIYGTILLGIEPNIKAGVLNVPGGSSTEVARFDAFRPLTGIALAARVPSLINVIDASGIAFNENIPLRNQSPVVNNVAGAMAIQQLLDRFEWVQQAGNPVAYAPYIRKHPLRGSAAKPVVFQFAKGDVTVPNPTTTAILRAGDLADRAVYFRNDLAFAANPAVPKDPHNFLTNIGSLPTAGFAVAAQTQIAVFFASDGSTVIDPDGPATGFFEVPIVPPLPETLSVIP